MAAPPKKCRRLSCRSRTILCFSRSLSLSLILSLSVIRHPFFSRSLPGQRHRCFQLLSYLTWGAETRTSLLICKFPLHSNVFLEKLRVTQLVKKFPALLEPRGALPSQQDTANSANPEVIKLARGVLPSPRSHILFVHDPF